jgi:hypothetical protein
MHARIDARPGKIALLALLSDRPLFPDAGLASASLDEFSAGFRRALEEDSVRVLSSATRLIDSR